MNVSDLMSRKVISVAEDAPLEQVARLLIDYGISAIPVVRDGEPIGIVSEGDLVTGGERARMSRNAWFDRLINGQASDFRPEGRVARDVMTTPVITTEEHCDAMEAVRLMQAEHIKRLPVTRGGKLVGILSRADLLRGLAQLPLQQSAARVSGYAPNVLDAIDDHYAQDHRAPSPPVQAPDAPAPQPGGVSAADFRHAVEEAKVHEQESRAEERRRAATQHARNIEAIRDQHLTENFWRIMLHNAHHAAERGETEVQILRFPREICSDGGRAINVGDTDWPSTLHGQAAEVFHRWATDLRPRGFRLSARTLEYPGGLPGDIGLFLVWGG